MTPNKLWVIPGIILVLMAGLLAGWCLHEFVPVEQQVCITEDSETITIYGLTDEPIIYIKGNPSPPPDPRPAP